MIPLVFQDQRLERPRGVMAGLLGQFPACLDRRVAGGQSVGIGGGLEPGAVLGEHTGEGLGELCVDLIADRPQTVYADRGDCFLLL
ncbi:MAG: hypothetical protein ACT4NY_23620, partial [Pseudonocardiales bacterium]